MPSAHTLETAAILAAPAAAWAGTAYALGYWFPGYAVYSITQALAATPHIPLLIAAPAAAFVAAFGISTAASRRRKPVFSGAPFTARLRGTQMVKAAKLGRLTQAKAPQVTIGGIPLPPDVEKQHILAVGRTGSGKSVAFKEIAWTASRRGDRLIVVDANGDLLRRFFRKGDKILNPTDRRTEGWSFYNEIKNDWDYDNMVLSLLPTASSKESEDWNTYGRLLLGSVARKVANTEEKTLENVRHWTNIADDADLKEFLRGTEAETLCIKGAEKAFGSARFVIGRAFKAHRLMPKGDFSIRTWLEAGHGNLFITWRQDMSVTLQPLISAWADIICTSILSTPEDERRRIWFMLDELASLQQLPSLKDALDKGRKHGLRVAASILSTPGLVEVWGDKAAHDLRSKFGSLLALGAAKADEMTAKDLAAAIGEHEVNRERKSRQRGSSKGGSSSGETHAEHTDREPVVMASEIAGMPDLQGYLALAGDYPLAKIQLTPVSFKQQVPAFVER